MGQRLITRNPRTSKSPAYKALGLALFVFVLVFNPISIPWMQDQGWFPRMHHSYLHGNDLVLYFPLTLDLLFLGLGAMIFFAERRLPWYFNNSGLFNQGLFVLGLFLLLFSNPLFAGRMEILRFFFILALLFILINSFYLTFVRKKERSVASKGWRNLCISLYALAFIFLLLEGVFLFIGRTHHYNGTLASRTWFNRNWELNSMGYRDREIRPSDSSKTAVLFLGDSFTAGHGIADPRDRMSDQLERNLGNSQWRVYNLGHSGSDTRDAYRRLQEFPVEPDQMIYAWYANDIELTDSSGALSEVRAAPYHDLNFLFTFVVRRSYFLNYLYWLFPHPSELQDYGSYLRKCFADPAILSQHLADLQDLVTYAQERGIPLYVVVFPLLDQLEDTRFATDPIEQFFAEQGIPVVSVRAMLEDEKEEPLTVNKNDAHPSVFVHGKVADTLSKLIKGIP